MNEALELLRDLTSSEPAIFSLQYPITFCPYCKNFLHIAIEKREHSAICPWRRAKEYVQRHDEEQKAPTDIVDKATPDLGSKISDLEEEVDALKQHYEAHWAAHNKVVRDE